MLCVLPLLALLGCSSLPGPANGALRQLDYANDDLAAMLLVFDLPDGLEPLPRGMVVTFKVETPARGERQVRAVLAEADAEAVIGALPPPADRRSYYVFGFAPADQAALRAAQAWARSLTPAGNQFSVAMSPGFCRSEPVDPEALRVSVLLVGPGATRLAPLAGNQPLKTMLAAAGQGDLPACAGHSG